MARKVLSHIELDRYLDEFATQPDTFQRRALELIETFDKQSIDLEITDPATWHRNGTPVTSATIENQLRADIDNILILDREPEARLARRIEFARLRLEKLLAETGLSMTDLEHGVTGSPQSFIGQGTLTCSLPPKVCRRWAELHALRT